MSSQSPSRLVAMLRDLTPEEVDQLERELRSKEPLFIPDSESEASAMEDPWASDEERYAGTKLFGAFPRASPLERETEAYRHEWTLEEWFDTRLRKHPLLLNPQTGKVYKVSQNPEDSSWPRLVGRLTQTGFDKVNRKALQAVSAHAQPLIYKLGQHMRHHGVPICRMFMDFAKGHSVIPLEGSTAVPRLLSQLAPAILSLDEEITVVQYLAAQDIECSGYISLSQLCWGLQLGQVRVVPWVHASHRQAAQYQMERIRAMPRRLHPDSFPLPSDAAPRGRHYASHDGPLGPQAPDAAYGYGFASPETLKDMQRRDAWSETRASASSSRGSGSQSVRVSSTRPYGEERIGGREQRHRSKAEAATGEDRRYRYTREEQQDWDRFIAKLHRRESSPRRGAGAATHRGGRSLYNYLGATR